MLLLCQQLLGSKAQPHPVILQTEHEPPGRAVTGTGLGRMLQQHVRVSEVPLKGLFCPKGRRPRHVVKGGGKLDHRGGGKLDHLAAGRSS